MGRTHTRVSQSSSCTNASPVVRHPLSPQPASVPVNADLIQDDFALCVSAQANLRVASTLRIFCVLLKIDMIRLQDIFGAFFRGERPVSPVLWAAALAELLDEGKSIAGVCQQEWYKHAEQLYESKVMHSVKAEEFNMVASSQEVLQRFVAIVSEVNADVTTDDICTMFAFGALISKYVLDVFRAGVASYRPSIDSSCITIF